MKITEKQKKAIGIIGLSSIAAITAAAIASSMKGKTLKNRKLMSVRVPLPSRVGYLDDDYISAW